MDEDPTLWAKAVEERQRQAELCARAVIDEFMASKGYGCMADGDELARLIVRQLVSEGRTL